MNDRIAYRATRLAESNAELDVQNSEILRAMTGAEPNVCDCLARQFKNLKDARKQLTRLPGDDKDKYALEGVLTAVSLLHRDLVNLRSDVIREECLEAAIEEEHA